jgi:AcrR family transcriptional regulator
MARRARSVAPALSRLRILAEAQALTAASGLAALSTRRLAERLGVEAMSIYHHFPSKHHLLDAMVDAAIASIEPPPPGLPPLERLRLAAHAYRAMAQRHAALFPLVAVHRLNTPTGVRFIEATLALVQAVVPDAERAARHFRVLGYYLMGAGLDETAGYAKGPSAVVPVDDAFIARECPRLAAAAGWFGPGEWDATFELGLQAILASIARDSAP